MSHFHSKIVGVTHKNDDGTDRQRIIAKCKPLEKLTLDHDENNRFDKNAVRVLRKNGSQLGFLSREMAEEIVRKSKRGHRFDVVIKNLTGGTRSEPTRGVNILLIEAPPGVTAAEAQAYVDRIDLSDADESDDDDGIDDKREARGSGCGTRVFGFLIVAVAAVAVAFFNEATN